MAEIHPPYATLLGWTALSNAIWQHLAAIQMGPLMMAFQPVLDDPLEQIRAELAEDVARIRMPQRQGIIWDDEMDEDSDLPNEALEAVLGGLDLSETEQWILQEAASCFVQDALQEGVFGFDNGMA